MLSDRARRRIEQLLDEADQAIGQEDWELVRKNMRAVLTLDPANGDAESYLAAAERGLAAQHHPADAGVTTSPSTPGIAASRPAPTAFAEGRYEVKRFLGEGGKKRVYLAHDTKLDRDVAFALIKTEGLDDEGLLRIKREAQAMGRLGDHPHIVAVYDIGDEQGQP